MSQQDHEHLRVKIILAAVMFALLFGVGAAKAQTSSPLPEGVTCDQVWYYAKSFHIPDTRLGHVRAKIIAAALGFRLTDAQLEWARQCIQSKRDLQ